MTYREISAQKTGGYYNVAYGGDPDVANLFSIFPHVLLKEYPSNILETIGPTMLVEWTDE